MSENALGPEALASALCLSMDGGGVVVWASAKDGSFSLSSNGEPVSVDFLIGLGVEMIRQASLAEFRGSGSGS